jgi:hypothetical protein
MSPSRFRLLMGLYLLVLIASVVVALLPGDYSAALAAAYESEPPPALLGNPALFGAIATALVALYVVGLVGLFFFQRWARGVSVYGTVVGLALFPFLGPSLASGAATSMSEAASVLWGVILACAYFSPVSARFVAGGKGASVPSPQV